MATKRIKKRGNYKYGKTPGNSDPNNYLETPADALAENDIDIARAQYEGMTNPWVVGMKAVGNLAMQYGISQGGLNSENAEGKKLFPEMSDESGNMLNSLLPILGNMAYGGKVGSQDIEAEGGEVIDVPGGMKGEIKGPKHEQGGVPIDNVPEGTEIYSDRIIKDGMPLSDRHAKRLKKIARLKRKLEKNPSDKITQNTYERTMRNLEAEKAEDMAIQDMVSFMAGSHSQAMFGLNGDPGLPDLLNFMCGGTVGKRKKAMWGWPPQDDENNPYKIATDKNNFSQMAITPPPAGVARPQNVTEPNLNELLSWTPEKPSLATPGITAEDSNSLGFTTGDAIGMGGNLFSMFAPYWNTLKNRAGDVPNVNTYKDYGKEGLETINKAKDYVATIADEAKGDVELSRVAGTKRGRAGARGVNTMRATDLASTQIANEADQNINVNQAAQMMQLLGMEAQAQDKQDLVVAKGEAEKLDFDKQDRDNFFTQKSANLQDIGTGFQQIGKELNTNKQQEVILQLLNQLSKYGITIDAKDFKLKNPTT